ncbi:MAG: nitrilase-related carbon-nitrogen hydrolase [Bacteroidota bacterium]
MKFRIALAQMDPVLGDLGANIERHLNLSDRAAAAGAHLVVFPELSLTGYAIKDLNWNLAINPRRTSGSLAPLVAQGKKIAMIAGGVEEGESFGLYNSAFYFGGGELQTVHRKSYPPTYGMFEEMRYFSRGVGVRAFDTPFGRLGVLICEDLWHLPLPYLLAADGAMVIIALVASPTRLSGTDPGLPIGAVNSENHKVYSRLLSVYIAFCNRVGFEDGVNFWGGSEVVSPQGEILASARLFEEDLIVADVDEEEVRRARRLSRHFLDDDPALVEAELRRIRESARRGDVG